MNAVIQLTIATSKKKEDVMITNIKNINISIFELFSFFKHVLVLNEKKLNKKWTIVAWHRPVIDVYDRVNDDTCIIVEMANENPSTTRGEGFAIFNHDKVEYEFTSGDIVHPNILVFRKKEEKLVRGNNGMD